MLKHLILVTEGGLANRLRTAASAKRLCEAIGARCTVVWGWANHETLFEPDPGVEVVAALPPHAGRGCSRMRTLLASEGGSPGNWRVPVDGPERILLRSYHCFGSESDRRFVDEATLVPWLWHPSAAIRQRVRTFRSAAFPAGPVVGLHMRRTDWPVTALSPDDAFLGAARKARDGGAALYLATDDRRAEGIMRERFADGLVSYPKDLTIDRRAETPGGPVGIEEDYIDFLLLASCDYVLGSFGSSYSMMAMALNGSPRCRVLTPRWRFVPLRTAVRRFVRTRVLAFRPGIVADS